MVLKMLNREVAWRKGGDFAIERFQIGYSPGYAFSFRLSFEDLKTKKPVFLEGSQPLGGLRTRKEKKINQRPEG